MAFGETCHRPKAPLDRATAILPYQGNASAKAQTADILAFGRSQGLYGGVSLEGAAISPMDDWNRQYYGKPVQVFDILINLKWHNPQSEPLRRILPQPGPNAQPIGR